MKLNDLWKMYEDGCLKYCKATFIQVLGRIAQLEDYHLFESKAC